MYYWLLLILIIVIGYGIISAQVDVEGIDYPGQTSQKIFSAIELANRATFYIDLTAQQSIRNAVKTLNEDSGFNIERSSDFVEPYPCGEVVYPLLNKEKNEVECFPDYEERLNDNFDAEFTRKIQNYAEIDLTEIKFTKIIDERGQELALRLNSEPIMIPIYTEFSRYYSERLKQELSQTMPSHTYTETDEGYYFRSGLRSTKRINPPDSIVFHYTAGHEVDHAYEALWESRLSYHYIIDKDGKIYQFVDESRAAIHAGCQISNERGFPCDSGYNQRSIGISFVNLGHAGREGIDECEIIPDFNGIKNACWQEYTQEQQDAAIRLIADIVERQEAQGNTIRLNRDTIKTHQEIDPHRKYDPGPLFDKEELITEARNELRRRGSLT